MARHKIGTGQRSRLPVCIDGSTPYTVRNETPPLSRIFSDHAVWNRWTRFRLHSESLLCPPLLLDSPVLSAFAASLVRVVRCLVRTGEISRRREERENSECLSERCRYRRNYCAQVPAVGPSWIEQSRPSLLSTTSCGVLPSEISMDSARIAVLALYSLILGQFLEW